MERFESNHYGNIIITEYNEEEENIYEIIERFKYFLLAKSYLPEMVERIMYMDDAQYAKLKLIDE